MNQEENSPSDIIYGVVRCERPSEDLFSLGIKVELVGGQWTVHSPSMEGVKLKISDIAYGLLKLQSRPDELKKWARLILMGSGFIDLPSCAGSGDWDVLLSALWQAMEKGRFSSGARWVAEKHTDDDSPPLI